MKKRTLSPMKKLVVQLERMEYDDTIMVFKFQDGEITEAEWKDYSKKSSETENKLIRESVDEKYIEPRECSCGRTHLNELFWEDYKKEGEQYTVTIPGRLYTAKLEQDD